MKTNSEDIHFGWKTKKLNEIAEFMDNKRKPVNEEERRRRLAKCKTRYPYYGANGQVGWIDDYIFNEELVLLAEDGGFFGSKVKPIAYMISGKTWVNNHAHVLRAKSGVLNKWLLYSLMFYDIENYVGGTTRLKLDKSDAEELPIKCPPFSQQRKLVAKLDVFFKHYNTTKTKYELERIQVGKIMQTVMNKSFSTLGAYEKTSLGDLIDQGPQNGIYKPKSFYGKGVPIVRINSIYDHQLIIDNIKNLELTKSEIENYNLKIGDIILNRVNSKEHIGKCCVYAGEFPYCVFESNMMRFRVNDKKISPKYVLYYLSSQQGLEQIKTKMKEAVNQVSVNQNDVKSITIPLPPSKKQKEVITKLDSINQILSLINEKLKQNERALDILPNAVIHKAWNGGIT